MIKYGITVFKNAVVNRFMNRRLVLTRDKSRSGATLQIFRASHEVTEESVFVTTFIKHHRLVVTLGLSNEALKQLRDMLNVYFDKDTQKHFKDNEQVLP